jgi:DNA-binding beta-propeller fold protein YncE
MQRLRTFHPRLRSLSLVALLAAAAVTARASEPTIGSLSTVTPLSSTVPANGDLNPYGVALVPKTQGNLIQGQFLISNFNNSANLQGTGTTIVQIAADGSSMSLFAQIDSTKVNCPGGIGLTTALVALRSGYVIVGSLPTATANATISGSGCLIVLDSRGNVVETFSGHNLNGPWDMAAVDADFVAALFVTNVLNGTVAANGSVVNGGTVVRLLLFIPPDQPPQIFDDTVIANGFPERTDPVALVIGPTGVAFDFNSGALYVADTLNNRIAAIPDALFRWFPSNGGLTLTENGYLNGPLGLSLTPDGRRLIAANGGDGNLVEIDASSGNQISEKLVDNTPPPPLGAGALFGLYATENSVFFVDDDNNNFNVLH